MALTYDYDHWETFNGHGPRDVTLIATRGATTVGTGEASNLEYTPVGDGSTLAEIAIDLAQ